MCWSISVRCGMLEAATRLGVASYLRRIYGSAVHEEASRFPGRGVRVRARGCELLSRLQDGDTSVVVIVALKESADSEATLASINETVAASFPAASCRSEAGGGVLFPLGEIRD
mgnify:CR=1 FL=1